MPSDDALEHRIDNVFDEHSQTARFATNPIVQFVLGTAPYGGGVAAILSRQAQIRLETRLRDFLLEFASEIQVANEKLVELLDETVVTTDDFITAIQFTLGEVASSTDDQKREYLKQYLKARCLKVRPDTTWQAILDGYVKRLSGAHLVLLAAIHRRQGHLPAVERTGSVAIAGVLPMEIADLQSELHWQRSLVELLASDLVSMRLIAIWAGNVPSGGRPDRSYSLDDGGLKLMTFLGGNWIRLPRD